MCVANRESFALIRAKAYAVRVDENAPLAFVELERRTPFFVAGRRSAKRVW